MSCGLMSLSRKKSEYGTLNPKANLFTRIKSPIAIVGIIDPVGILNGSKNSRNQDFQLWQQHNHPIEISSDYMFDQKVNYIHANPVKAGIVEYPESWKWSSAIDYNGGKGLLDITWS